MTTNNQKSDIQILDIFDKSNLNDKTVLIQQCNVVRRIPHGLSADFVLKLGKYTDVYSLRRGGTRNTAIISDRPELGTISWCCPKTGNRPYVVNFFSQYDSGKSIDSCMTYSLNYKHLSQDTHFHLNKKLDTRNNRLGYFKSCLTELIDDLDFMSCLSELDNSSPKITKICFPFRIGCGLAGGVWRHYKQAIDDFSRNVNQAVIIAKTVI